MKNIALVFLFLVQFLPFFLSAEQPPITPPSLKPGDTIAIVAPAFWPLESQNVIARTVKELVRRGYRVKVAPNLMTRYGYLAGTDYDRAKAFMDAWLDPEVRAVWCYRGGYGCTRILDRIDYQIIKKNPKILIGMSDTTALHAAINKKTGLITFLGPHVNDIFGKDMKAESTYNEIRLWEMIAPQMSVKGKGHLFSNPKSFPGKQHTVMTLNHGSSKGRLAGGTLSLVTSLIGTPWELDTKGKILVLEEVGEPTYRIDRMLSQMKHSGLLEHPAGVILCSWTGCNSGQGDKSLSLVHLFKEYFAHARYPVLLGFPSGHIPDQATLPLNALAELDATNKTLRLLEDPVMVH